MTNSQDPIDQDHPLVQEVQQIVIDHGWMIAPGEAIDLVQQAADSLLKQFPPESKSSALPPESPPFPPSSGPPRLLPGRTGVQGQDTSPKPAAQDFVEPISHTRGRRLILAEQIFRDLLPDRIHDIDGTGADIPDDLYEEMAALLVDRSKGW